MQVSDEIIKVLEYLGQKFGIAFDSTKENIVPYAQQLAEKYIRWEISTSIVWICVAVLMILISSLLLIRSHNSDDYDLSMFGTIFFGAVILFMIIIIIFQVFNIIQCNVFPEKQIYEYVSSLMQNR